MKTDFLYACCPVVTYMPPPRMGIRKNKPTPGEVLAVIAQTNGTLWVRGVKTDSDPFSFANFYTVPAHHAQKRHRHTSYP